MIFAKAVAIFCLFSSQSLDKCCAQPVGDLASSDVLQACNEKKDKELNSWVNDYKLNKLQSLKKSNTIDLKDKSNQRILCKVAPFINCLFEKANLNGENEVINPEAVIKYLTSDRAADDPWRQKLTDHINGVGPFEDYVPKTFDAGIVCPGGMNVSLRALVLVQFLQLGIVDMCPEQAAYTKGNKCKENLASWNSCYKNLWSNLYPEKSAKKAGQAFSAHSAPLAAGGKKSIRDYINNRLMQKGEAPHN